MENFLNRLLAGDIAEKNKILEKYVDGEQYIVLTCIMEKADGSQALEEVNYFEKVLEGLYPAKKVFEYAKESTYLIKVKHTEAYTQTLSLLSRELPDHGLFYLIGVSSFYSDSRKFKNACEESWNALNSCNINFFENNGCICFYGEKGVEGSNHMEVCVKDIELIVNTLCTCNMKGIQDHLDRIISPNKEKSYIVQKELYNYLMSIFYAVVNSQKMNPEEILSMSFNQYVSGFKEVYGIKLLHKKVIENYVRLIIETSKGKEERIDRIIEYIKDNYGKQISLQRIADEFDMSSTYFSQYFKKCTGTNFIDFVRDIRIKNAKEILKNENITICEVAQRTGFDTVNTFIRIFKKLTGITPGEYKSTIGVSA